MKKGQIIARGLRVQGSRKCFLSIQVIGVFLGLAGSALAWVYPEHRDIAVLAVQGLDPERKAEFDRLWQEARGGDEQRLCAQGADAGQGLAPPCIDWAGLSGIAGDHSCSSQEMLDTVLASDWILAVADVAAQLKVDLAAIPVTAPPGPTEDSSTLFTNARRRLADQASRARRSNALRTSDTRLQRADPQYATRAEANNAHFMLSRPDTNMDPHAYEDLALKVGSEINAPGVYFWYHTSALQKASRLAKEQLTPEQRRALARSAMFDEAFALHFLEDVYASGHLAGSWGDVSQRKGTHDFYNQNGLEVFTWAGGNSSVVLMGDAHMRPQDAALAAKVVQTSLEQVLDTATGRSRGYDIPYIPMAPAAADNLDVCRNMTMPERAAGLRDEGRYRPAFGETLRPTPLPGLTPGLGALPRFRSELGPFIGMAGSIDGRGVSGGFEASQTKNGFIAGVDVSLRVGMGLEGALGDSGDGLVFAQVGIRGTTPSTNKFSETVPGTITGNLTAAIPAQWGLSTRIRMPFYLIPGDLLLLSPMYLFNRQTYIQMAITAVNGGLIPWQQVMATRFGRFQFMLGREFGVTFYGLGGNAQLLAPSDPPGDPARVVSFKSIGYDLPILEYRPYQAFSSDQSSSLLFHLFAGADVPYGSSVDSPPGAPSADLHTVWSLGLRMSFIWRYYW